MWEVFKILGFLILVAIILIIAFAVNPPLGWFFVVIFAIGPFLYWLASKTNKDDNDDKDDDNDLNLHL